MLENGTFKSPDFVMIFRKDLLWPWLRRWRENKYKPGMFSMLAWKITIWL